MKRSFTELVRHPMKIKGQFAAIVVSVLIVGFIFLNSVGDVPLPYSS